MLIGAAIALQAHAKDTPIDGVKGKFQGLPITIEHRRGSVRKLHDDSGKLVYKQQMHCDYGFLNGTKGRDGDEVDCFIGPSLNAEEVYVIHMKDMGPVPEEREDEDKCMIGFPSADTAKAAFLMHYPPNFYGGMTSLPLDTFRQKLAEAQKPHMKKKITAKGGPAKLKPFRQIVKDLDKAAGAKRFRSTDESVSSRLSARFVRVAEARSYGKLGKAKCPKCGSIKLSLMPTDFETAKCQDCGKTFAHPNPPKPGVRAGGPGSGPHKEGTPVTIVYSPSIKTHGTVVDSDKTHYTIAPKNGGELIRAPHGQVVERTVRKSSAVDRPPTRTPAGVRLQKFFDKGVKAGGPGSGRHPEYGAMHEALTKSGFSKHEAPTTTAHYFNKQGSYVTLKPTGMWHQKDHPDNNRGIGLKSLKEYLTGK